MKDMKMKTKMILGFAIPIILAIINVLVGISAVRTITKDVVKMQEQEVATINKTMEEIGADETKAQILIDKITSSKTADMEDILNAATFSNIASGTLIVVSVLISIVIAISLIKIINKSVAQLSKAASDIAMGRVDIEMVKFHNDEFGELVDKYTEVVDNIKYQAQVAEEVSNGNLTVQVNVKSSEAKSL